MVVFDIFFDVGVENQEFEVFVFVDVRVLVFELCSEFECYECFYYCDGKLEISDCEFDVFLCWFEIFEEVYLVVCIVDSLIQWVGGVLFEGFEQVVYDLLMFFFDNVYGGEELGEWGECLGWLFVGDFCYFVVEFKVDGVLILFFYEDGVLVQVVMRGNGKVGDVVIENVCMICLIFLCFEGVLLCFFVWGEVFMLCLVFVEFNEQCEWDGLQFYVNFCNMMVGMI